LGTKTFLGKFGGPGFRKIPEGVITLGFGAKGYSVWEIPGVGGPGKTTGGCVNPGGGGN